MKRKISPLALMMAVAGTCSAQSLYHKGSEAQDSVPLTFTVGAQMTYDDNVAPGELTKSSSLGFNPYVGASFITITPQTTWNVYVRLGLVYLFDAPPEIDDITSQSRAGVNFTHRFSERLRFTSENFLAYELEPDFANGIGASRRLGPFIAWSTNNSIGYRWTERFGNYVGFSVNGVDYDTDNNDRLTWELYNQFRYQLGPQTVLTGDYRYSQTTGDGLAADSTNQFLLVGVEQRFSPTMIGVARVGAQFRDVNDGDSLTSPYAELALNTAVNKAFSLRAFTRYGIESGDTVRFYKGEFTDYNERETLRIGLAGDYVISPTLSLFGGIDYVPTTFASGKNSNNTPYTGGNPSEDIFNAFIGVSIKINEMLTASASYNYTNSTSDFANQTYERNRISVGVSAQF
jgi:Outer membrane protein beta-barrel domain